MTNFEKYKKELIEMMIDSYNFLGLANGVPTLCNKLDCSKCDWFDNETCRIKRKEWIESEYVEPKIQPEVKNLHIDGKVLVSADGEKWEKRYFHYYNKEKDMVYAYDYGTTSWTAERSSKWIYAKLPDVKE